MNPLAVAIIAAGRDKPAGVYLLRETFEGSNADSQSVVGYDNAGWVSTNAANNPRYNTSPAPLQGSYSYHVANAARLLTHSLSGSPRYFFFKFAVLTSGGADKLQFLNGSTTVLTLESDSGTPGRLRVKHGSTASSYVNSILLDTGEVRYCWLDYVPGSGSDGVANLYLSATSTKPGSPTATVTTGTATLEINKWQVTGMGAATVLDLLIASTNPIGSNPS